MHIASPPRKHQVKCGRRHCCHVALYGLIATQQMAAAAGTGHTHGKGEFRESTFPYYFSRGLPLLLLLLLILLLLLLSLWVQSLPHMMGFAVSIHCISCRGKSTKEQVGPKTLVHCILQHTRLLIIKLNYERNLHPKQDILISHIIEVVRSPCSKNKPLHNLCVWGISLCMAWAFVLLLTYCLALVGTKAE